MQPSTFTLTVGQIAHLGVITIASKASIKDAIDVMLQNNLRDVIYEIGSTHRIFTIGDLLDYSSMSKDLSKSLDTLPQHNLRKVCEKENVEDVLSMFDRSGDGYLGVTNKKKELIGVVSYTDVISALDPSVFIQKKMIGEVMGASHRIAIPVSTVTRDIIHHFSNAENAVVVVDKEIPVGILTSKDSLYIIQKSLDIDSPVSDYMTSPVDTIPNTMMISEVLSYLQESGFKRAIIVDDKKNFVGAVGQSDLASYALNNWSQLVHSETKRLSETARSLELQAKVHEVASYTDALTKVGNRRKFEQAVRKEMLRSNRYDKHDFSLILFDIDYFKKVNDKYGHTKGDEVLKGFSFEVQMLLRELDTFCRWGGEEFVVLLPETKAKGACELAERIRKLVKNGVHQEISITVSAGVHQYAGEESMEELVHNADKALYMAKENGRDRVESMRVNNRN